MPVSIIPQNFDGTSGGQVPVNAPQYSGVSQAGGQPWDMQRQQWLENRAAYYRAQAQQAQLAQQQQAQMPQITPSAFAQQGGFNLYSQQNPGRIATPEGEDPRREMNFLERGIAYAGNDLSNLVSSYSGFDPDKGFTLENMAAFVASLPGQMASGMLQAPANFASGLTGNQYLDNPYTEELEVNTQNGTITTETLDGAQRVAQLANGVINSGLTGASGQFVRAWTPWFRTVGKFGREIMRDAPKAAQIGLSVGAATAEEAGEEFVQSYLDDISFDHMDDDSFNRALESAKWGAIGGGIMSAAGHGVSYIHGKLKPEAESGAEAGGDGVSTVEPQIQDSSAEYEKFRVSGGTWEGMDATAEEMKQRMQKIVDNTPGSMVVKHAKTDTSFDINEGVLSDRDIREAYDRSTSEGREVIAKAFGVQKSILEAALYEGTYGGVRFNNSAEALTKILDDNRKGGMKIALMRNPDTNNGGFYLNVYRISHGGDIQVHPAVYTLFGADVDGDTSVVYFDPSVANTGGYALELAVNPEGKVNFDETFLAVKTKDALTDEMIERAVRNAFEGYADSDEAIQFHIKNLKQARDNGKGYSVVLNEIRAAVMQAARKSEDSGIDPRQAGLAAASGVLREISDTSRSLYQNTMMPHVHATIKQELSRDGKIDEWEKFEKVMNEVRKVEASGKIAPGSLPIDIFEYIGFLTYNLTANGNLVFRQYGEAGFTAKSVNEFLKSSYDAQRIVGNADVFQALIRTSFRMISEGVSPKTAVEGMFRSYVISNVMAEWGGTSPDGNRINTGEDIDRFSEIFQRRYDEAVEMYNNAIKVLTQEKYEIPFGVTPKSKLETVKNPAFPGKLVTVMGTVPMSAIFDTKRIGGENIDLITLEQFVAPLAKKGDLRSFLEVYSAGGKVVQKFANRLISGYQSNKKVFSKNVYDLVTGMNFGTLLDRWNNGTFSDSDFRAFQCAMDAYSLIIDPEIALNAGLYGPEILNTRIGQMLVSNNANDRINALVGITLNETFRKVAVYLKSDDENTRVGARQILLEMSEISDIHRVISLQLQESNGESSTLLDYLTDLNTSWETKQDHWNEIERVGGITAATDDLMLDCLTSQNSDFDLSGFSDRFRKAQSSARNFEKLKYEHARGEVDRLIAHHQSTEHKVDIVGFIKDIASAARQSFDLDVLGLKVYASTVLVNAQMEKGTNENAGTLSYQMLERIVNGAMLPYMNQITGEERGVGSAQYFTDNRKLILRMIADREFEFNVYDVSSDTRITISFDVLMKDIDPSWEAGQEMDEHHVWDLLKKYPQLVDVLTDARPQGIMSNGIVSTSMTKTSSMIDLYKRYAGRTSGLFLDNDKDEKISYEMERRMEEISNLLVNWKDYTGYLVRAGGSKLAKASSPKEINDIIRKKHNQFVRAIYKMMLDDPDGQSFATARDSYFADMIDRTASDFESLTETYLASLDNYMDQTQIESNIARTLSQGIIDNILIGEINPEYKKRFKEKVKVPKSDIEDDFSIVKNAYKNSGHLDAMASISDRTIHSFRKMFTILYYLSEKRNATGNLTPSSNLRKMYSQKIIKTLRKQYKEDPNHTDNPDDSTIMSWDEYKERMEFIDSKIKNFNLMKSLLSSEEAGINVLIDESDYTPVGPDTITLENDEVIYDISDEMLTKIVVKAIRLTENSRKAIPSSTIRKEFETARSDYREGKGLDGFKNLMRQYNGTYYASIMNDIKSTIGGDMNSNVITDTFDTIDSFEDMLTEVRMKLDPYDSTTEFKFETSKLDWSMPKMEFGNTRLQAMASSLQMVERGSMASTKVGINGSMTKMLAGFGFLNPREMKNAPYRTATVSEFLNLTGHGDESADNWQCTLSGDFENLEGKDVKTVKVMKRYLRKLAKNGNLDPNMTVYYFHPDDNAHGIYDLNSPRMPHQTARKYSRLGMILGILQDDAQEAMVLKAKKAFLASTKWIVDERNVRTPREAALKYGCVISADQLADWQSAHRTLRSALLRARRGFANELFEEFQRNHSKSELSRDSARILSQALTPAWELRLSDGREVFFDVEHLFHDPRRDNDFENAWKAIVGDAQVVEARIRFATPEEVSGKILHAVSNMSEDKFKKFDLVRETAANAVKSWDGEQVNSMKVSKLMSMINPVGFYNHFNSLMAENSRTAQQAMVSAMFDSRFGMVPNTPARLPKMKPMKSGNKNSQKRLKIAKKNYRFAHSDMFAVRSFIPESYRDLIDSNSTSNEIWKKYSGIMSDVDGYDENAVGIVFSEENMTDAIQWAQKTGNKLAMPEELFNSYGFLNTSHDKMVQVQVKPGTSESFYVVDVMDDIRFRNLASVGVTSSRVFRDVDDIYATFFDEKINGIANATDNGLFGLGDAELIGWNRAGELTRLRANHGNIDASLYLGKEHGPYRVLKSDEIVSKFGNKNSAEYNHLDLRYYRGQNASTIRNAVEDFAHMIEKLGDNVKDGVVKGGVKKGEVYAIITDGVNYAPIMLPDSATRTTKYTGAVMYGSTLQVYWSGETKVGGDENERIKMAIDGEAFKGELSMAAPDQHAPLMHGCDMKPVQMAASADTQKSRAWGKDDAFFARDLYYFSKLMGREKKFSYMYDRKKLESADDIDKNNLISYLRDDIVKAAVDLYGPDMERVNRYLRDFISGDIRKGLWNDLMIGRAKLYPDTGGGDGLNVTRNIVIQKVLRACYAYHIDPRDLFDMANMHLTNGRYQISDVRFMMAFGNLSRDELLAFFSGLDDRICVSSISDSSADAAMDYDQPAFNRYGRFKVDVFTKANEKHTRYALVRFGPVNSLGDESYNRVVGANAAYPWQHIYRRALDFGYLPSEITDVIRYTDFLLADTKFLDDRNKLRIKEATDKAYGLYGNISDENLRDKILREYPNDSYTEIEHKIENMKRGKNMRKRRTVTEQGKIVENPYKENDNIKNAVRYFNDKLKLKVKFTNAQLEIESQRQDGHTYNENGVNSVSPIALADSIRAIADNVVEYGIPIRTTTKGTLTQNNRYALPMLSQDEVNWWWENCQIIRDKWGTRDAFVDALFEESKRSMRAISQLGEFDSSKARALMNAMEFDLRLWGKWDPSQSPYTYGGVYVWDQVNSVNKLADAIRGTGDVGFDVDEFKEMCKNSRQFQADIINALNNTDRFEEVDLEETKDGKIRVYMKTVDDKVYVRILDNATQLSQIMALISPGVMVGNMLDRSIHQGITAAAIWLGNKLHVGPYQSKHVLPPSLVDEAVNDEVFLNMYIAYRMAAFDGSELQFIANMQGPEQAMQWLAERRKKMTPYQKAVERIYGLSSGGNKFLKTQMKNFINRFVMFAEENGHDFWFETQGNGRSLLENQLSNPAKWFADVLGARGGNNPSTVIALQAMNSAKTGDMAQRNVIGMMFAEAVRNRPLPKFLVTTMVSRFPQYSLNVAGRMLNWVLPMSSINYVFTNFIAERAHEKAANDKTGRYADPHYEQAQIHRSLREAMLVDITHLGVTAVSGILVSLAGGIEPPEDERKWGNIDEWTIFGLRVGDAWWIEDVLGMALPSAAFTKSMMMGKPRFDILFNGAGQVMYNNPILKVADVVGFLADPEGNIMTNYEEDYKRFQDAKGGPPSYMDWIAANGTSLGLNWASQFILPSVVKEIYTSMQPYEVSYRTIYEENEFGALTEGGASGENVEKTTYQDAMLRRLTRRNPVLGWICDMVIHPNTGYLAGEMPRTRYIDDAQLAMAEQWSIEGLEPKEAEAKLLEIVAVMQGYDDMNVLRQTGFYLDSTTKAALSSLCWDTVNELTQWYNGLQADGYFDYYAWGDGDYNTGQEAVAQIKLYYNQCKEYWTDFYYNKVRSSALTEPMVVYNRYNTTYARDTEGNVYATGIRPQGILPFTEAPGQIGNAEGTAGWVNDWNTLSAVTGEPMDQRALIPVAQGYEDWPDLEDWADESNPNGYSRLYSEWHSVNAANESGGSGDGTGTGSLTGLPLVNGKPASSSSKSTRVYGGGGYSRGGGGGGYSSGGGGYYPTIRSSWYTPNMTSPYPMDRVSRRRSDYDYLRPAFETKGSREAYRREDI